MHTLDDVHRSIRRHVAAALEWKVRLVRQQIQDEERPLAVVEMGVLPGPTFARQRHPEQGDIRQEQPYTISAYPVVQEERAGRLEAARVAQLLQDAIVIGLIEEAVVGPPAVPEKPLGMPYMIPLYDYAGVDVDGTEPGPAEPYDYLDVEDLSARPLQDPADPRRWAVTMDLRVGWWRPGRIPPFAPDAANMPGAYDPTP